MKALSIRVFCSLLMIALFSTVLVIASCGKSASGLSTYVIGDATGDWGHPSPYAHYSRGPGYTQASFIFDTLVWKGRDGFIPALAKEWEYLEDENAYIFRLRDNATWHDGGKVTAADVAFTVDYVKQHPYPFVTLIGPSGVEKTTIIDEYTVKLYLEQTYAAFLNDVASTLFILPQHIWESVENPEEFTSTDSVIGSGPFKLLDYSKEHGSYLYEAYDQYYLGRPVIDRLKFVKVSAEMIPSAIQQGSINAGDIPADVKATMEAAGLTVIRSPYGWNAKMMINHTKQPLNDKKFRQALAYAIDREELVNVALRGHAAPGSPGILPQDSPWFNPDIEMYEHDPEKALQLLAELGYQPDSGLLKKDGTALTLSLVAASDFKEVGQFIEAALEELGITIDFQLLEGKTVDARVSEWNFDLSIYGHGGLYEASILNKIITGAGFNSARYTSNTQMNNLLKDQLSEMDADQRKSTVQQIQAVYADEMPALTLYYPDWYWAHDGAIDLFYTEGGIGSGTPLPINKLCFLGTAAA